MNKDEFRNLVIPLTQKEISYRDHPDTTNTYYRTPEALSLTDLSGVPVFPFPDTTSADSGKQHLLHGNIIPGENIQLYGTPIVLGKQTRFAEVPLHRHAYIEIAYMYAGKCTTVINGETVNLKEGDTVIFDSGVIHRVMPTGANDILINIMMRQDYFQKNFIERFSEAGTVSSYLTNVMSRNKNHDHYLLFHTRKNARFKNLMEDLYCEFLDPMIETAYALDSYIDLLFIEMIRCYQTEKEEAYRKENKKSYITEILQYIEENAVSCTLEETAEQFGYHPNYLTRAIKKATGKSFKELSTDLRLSKAARLLITSDAPVSQIAEQCGYTNQNYFYKKFESLFHMTPANYRAQNK